MKWSESHSVVSDSLRPCGLYSPWDSSGQNTGVGAFPFPGDLPNAGIEPRYPALQVDSLPPELPGKPMCIQRLRKNGYLDGVCRLHDSDHIQAQICLNQCVVAVEILAWVWKLGLEFDILTQLLVWVWTGHFLSLSFFLQLWNKGGSEARFFIYGTVRTSIFECSCGDNSDYVLFKDLWLLALVSTMSSVNLVAFLLVRLHIMFL